MALVLWLWFYGQRLKGMHALSIYRYETETMHSAPVVPTRFLRTSNTMSDNLDKAAQWMTDNQSDAAKRLQRWCDQNSWSMDAQRLRDMADRLCEDFACFGVDFHQANLPALKTLGDEEAWAEQETGPALIWHHNAQAQRRVLLMIHYDTVYPMGSEPAKCTAKGSKLIGPGTADAKGGIAVIAMAVEAILKFDLASDVGVSIFLNPDEEVGSTASRELMSRIAPKFDAGLLFEPSLPSGALVRARKGSGNFSFVARGRSAHAGRNPEAGRNAIVHLSKMVSPLTALHNPRAGVLLNIGRIAGGGPLNRVPDHAVMQLNVRVTDQEKMKFVESSLAAFADQFTHEDYRVTLTGMFTSPPKPMSDEIASLQPLVEAAGKTAGRTIAWEDTGGACDGCKLAAFGLPNIDTLGISGGNLHSPEEFCDLESLVPAAHTVAAFINAF